MHAEAARQAAAQEAADAKTRVQTLEEELGAAHRAAEAQAGTARKLAAELAEARRANQVRQQNSAPQTPSD